MLGGVTRPPAEAVYDPAEGTMPMALFFFHFTNGRTIRDEEGENFPSLEAAKAHAAKIAAELATEPESQGFAVSVTDEQGNELAYVTIGRSTH
jgi:hypothetical protein